jgi:DNA-binding CsgD family transcriptional regulator
MTPHSNLRCELLERAHAAIEPNWGAVAELLRKTFQGDNCCIVLIPANGLAEVLGHAGLNHDWLSLYEERYAAVNPFLVEAARRRPENGGAVVATADHLIPFTEIRQTDFYKNFWVPLGVNDSVGALAFDGEKPIGHIMIRRRSGNLRYGEAEEARLRSIVDILTSAMVRCLRMRMARARIAALDQITSRVQGGLIILDERGQVLEAEGAGRTVVEQHSTQFGEALTRFQADPAASHGRIEAGESPRVAGQGHAGLDYEFRKVVIEGRMRILCILGVQAAPPAEAVQLPSTAHFTPRERDVLTLLARGLDNLSIAKALGIGLYTTKDHVKSIFRKLSVKTRAEAVAVLSRPAAANATTTAN